MTVKNNLLGEQRPKLVAIMLTSANVLTMEEELLRLAQFAAIALDLDVDTVREIAKKADNEARKEFKAKWDAASKEIAETRQNEIFGALNRNIKSTFGEDVPKITKIGEIKTTVGAIKVASTQANQEGGMTEDQIKASSTYLDMVKTKDDEYTKLKNEQAKELQNRDITAASLGLRDSMKAIIPDDGNLASSKQEIFLDRILKRGYTFEPTQDGNFFIKEGDQYKLNANNHKMTLKELVEGETKVIYGIQTVDPKQNANPQGNPNPAGPTNPTGPSNFNFEHFKGTVPKSVADYQAILIDDNMPVQSKKEVREYWKTAPENPEFKPA